MRLPETRDLFARELSFPADRETVVDTVGDETLEAPNGEHETIREVLDRSQRDEFSSADELYDTLIPFVSDGFIGRKYYDDRGGQLPTSEDEEEVQF
jgi:hypothetical protein